MLSTKFKLVPFGQPYNSNSTANQIRFWHIEEGGTREFRIGLVSRQAHRRDLGILLYTCQYESNHLLFGISKISKNNQLNYRVTK